MSSLQQVTTLSLNDAPYLVLACALYACYRLALTHMALYPIGRILKVKQLFKFVHRAFDLTHYFASAVIGLIGLQNRPFGSCLLYASECETVLLPNTSAFEVTQYEKIYIIMFLAYYLVDVFFIWTQPDVITLSIHHLVTLGLILNSIYVWAPSMCLIIMVLHDIVDVPLYSGKIANYLGKKKLADSFLILFATLCIYFRNIILPIIVYKSYLNGVNNELAHPRAYSFLIMMLVMLIGCHVYWTYKILRVALDLVNGRKGIRDNRSD